MTLPLLEEGSALTHEDCPPYLHKQISQLHQGTWFVLANDTEVVKTEKGTRPGDGFADAIWSLVFAKWIHRIEDRLRSSGAYPPLLWNQEIGIRTSVGEMEIPYALVAWADDVVILGLDEDPEQLIAKLEFTCQIMVEELLTYGLLPNFNGGKTEAVVDPRGHGSTQVRRRIFTEGKGLLTIETPLPEQPPLKIVPRYKHLGGIITHGAKMRPEIAARAAQSLQAFNIYRNKVYSNPRIDIPTRFMVLQATALATLHYGSGTWSRLTANELKVWNTTHFTLYRKLLYKLFAFEDIRHMTDDEILVKVQQVHPTITLRLQRLHWYGSMLTRTCPNFWAITAYEKWWIQCVTDDLDWLFQQIVGYTWLPNPRDDLDAWHLYAIQFPNRWKKLLKRARLHAIWQHTVHFNVHRYHRKAFDLMVAAGAHLPKTFEVEVERAYYCFICRRSFDTYRAWAVHSFKLHQRINKWRRLQTGNVCLACAKQFPSEPRLIRHLQTVRKCADTVASQRLWVPPRPAFGSTVVSQQERGLLLSTWDYTDAPCLPETPGWTMTWQTRSFLQFCTTIQWTSLEALDDCLGHLQQHAVSAQEIDEIENALLMTDMAQEDTAAMQSVFSELRQQARPHGQTVSKQVPMRQCMDELRSASPPRWQQPERTPTRFRYVLHLYAGARRTGDLHTVIAELPSPDGFTFFPASLDVVLCPHRGDLLSESAQAFWINASLVGAVFAAIGGPPCESWSVARWNQTDEFPAPKPIRDGNDDICGIWALSTVRIRDLRQLDTANQLLLFMVILLITQSINGLCAIMEHPALPPLRNNVQPASIWLLPLIKYLTKHEHIHLLTIYQGFFDALSPKPTGLLIAAPVADPDILRRWMMKHQTRSTLPRALKMGRKADGTFHTAPLKRYPVPFCRAIGEVVHNVASIVTHVSAPDDEFVETFQELRQLYMDSKHDDDDGADYAPKEVPQKRNIIRCRTPSAVS